MEILALYQPEFIIDLTDFGLLEQGLYYGAYRTVVRNISNYNEGSKQWLSRNLSYQY